MNSHPFTRHNQGVLFREFIAALVKKRKTRTYLEIGVRDGATIRLIECDTIGVDPNFAFDCNPVGTKRNLYLYQMTSDEFFRDIDIKKIFGCTLDVVFLDGLHLFEFLLRDFINSERVCSSSSLIMLDDCVPVNVEMTERYHRPSIRLDKNLAGWWTGDVWKVVKILREYRSDLRLTAVDTSPTGTICVSNLDPQSNLLSEKYFEIVDKYRTLSLDDASLEKYIDDIRLMPAQHVLHEFDWSMRVGF